MNAAGIIATVCIAQFVGQLGAFTFPALLPTFIEAWALSHTQAGWLSGVIFGVYALSVLVLEKERQVGLHQPGRHSGVLHSGLYYRPGSLKARTCVRGSEELVAFCERHAIPSQRCGKVVVATSTDNAPFGTANESNICSICQHQCSESQD